MRTTPDSMFHPLQDDKILDWSELKQIADDILKCIKMKNKCHLLVAVEKNVRKGEIACYKQFLLFSQYFPQLNIFIASKSGIVW